jgi:hypothetical protein
VVPFGSKALWGFAVLALVAALAYGWSTGDASGGAILGSVAAGAVLLGVLVVVADPDRAPWVAPDAPLAEEAPVGGRPSFPSVWPLAGAVALGVLAVAAASNGVVVLAAVILLAVAGGGWMFQQWSEHPTYTSRYAARLKERLLLPVGLPVGVFCLVAVLAISLSRIFLALPENGTRAVALAIAVVIIVSAFVVAASDRMARTALTLLVVFAFASLIGAGIAGIAHGERKFDKPTKPIAHAPLPPGVNPSVTATSASGQTTTPPSSTATSTP